MPLQSIDCQKLTKILGYTFNNKKLLEQALTYNTNTRKNKNRTLQKDNQALATLGDGLLRAIIEDILLEIDSSSTKGYLSKTRDMLVNNNIQNRIAEKLGLGEFLIEASKKQANKKYTSSKVLADCLEAIIGAIFLDSERSYLTVKRFVIYHWQLQDFYNECLADAVAKQNVKQTDYFLDCGANPNMEILYPFECLIPADDLAYQPPDLYFITPMQLECKQIELEIKLLNGYDPDLLDEDDGSPTYFLLEAVEFQNIQLVEVLLKHGANVNQENNNGFTALYSAASDGNIPLAKLLRAYQADSIAIRVNGYTPLHIAVQYNHPAMVNYLLAEGVEPNQIDMNGQTPLHLAAKLGYDVIVQSLLAYNAIVDIDDDNDCNPFDLAKTAAIKEVLRMAKQVEQRSTSIDYRHSFFTARQGADTYQESKVNSLKLESKNEATSTEHEDTINDEEASRTICAIQ
jgi:ankyrin repeat protein